MNKALVAMVVGRQGAGQFNRLKARTSVRRMLATTGTRAFPVEKVRKAGFITEHTGESRRSTEEGKWRFAQSVRVCTHGRAPQTHSFSLLRGSPWGFVCSVIEFYLG